MIEAPAKRAKELQAYVLELLRRIELPDYLHSARVGHSYLSNSSAHVEVDGCTITMDIDSFYQNASIDRITRFFELRLKQPRDVAETFASLLCCDGHLATGSPASPLISFWAFREAFDAIEERVCRRGGVFTLYIDDMGITGEGFGHTDISWITRLLRRFGLTIKEEKNRVFRATEAKVITGRAWRNGISRAPNKQHRKMRAAQAQLELNPGDPTLKARLAGQKRHLALLDDAQRDRYRAEASGLTSSSKGKLSTKRR